MSKQNIHEIRWKDIQLRIKVIEQQSDPNDRIFYWWEATSAAVALAEYIFDMEDLVNKRVLELGCGPGIPGIMAAKRHATVVFTDYNESALHLAQENAKLNDLDFSKIFFVQLDWENPCEIGSFDVILGSEIVYDYSVHKLLMNLLVNSMNKDGCILLADRKRLSVSRFVGNMIRNGFSSSETIKEPQIPGFPKQAISIFKLH